MSATIEAIHRAGVALAQLKANGKLTLDEDGERWVQDVEAALSDAEDTFDRSAEAKLLEAAREYRDTTQDETATRTRRYAYAMRVLELCKELKP